MAIMFEKENWTLFRSIDTLVIRAGVSRGDILKVVIKELVDNALDAGYACEVGRMGNTGFFVQDDGEGIPVDQLGKLFSVNRSLVSSKLQRLQNRGALGNGLRVVSGSVLSLGGQIAVETHGTRFLIEMDERTGKAVAKESGVTDRPGTRIEVIYHNGTIRETAFSWGQDAILFNQGNMYKGKTSATWYTTESFYELANAYDGSVRDLVTLFDGWTAGTKAAEVAGDYKHLKANDLTIDQATSILNKLRESKPVKPSRLGKIGELEGYSGYHQTAGYYTVKSAREHDAVIPYVIEVFSNISEQPSIKAMVNKTPITDNMSIYKNKSELRVFGANLGYSFKCTSAEIVVNVSTPYMTITTDGKKPDFKVFVHELLETIQKSVGKAKRKIPVTRTKKRSMKEIIFDNMQAAAKKTSGNGQYRFSQRQLFYAIRPYVLNELEKEPSYDYFCNVITEYEQENGDIDLLYRDVRGVLYEPHTGRDIPLGTLEVERYERPAFTFNKILYSEKEGFFTILKSIQFPEKHDIALLTSKGYASRAAKDLIDMLGETDEEILFFCIHDADAAGTKIFESLQEATKARPQRKVTIINLGLDPQEALEMGLDTEKVESKGKKPVGNYLADEWKEWLQHSRVELNAMTTPIFIEWLERKLNDYDNGKIIPPNEVLVDQLKDNVKEQIKYQIKERILNQANYEQLVADAYNEIAPTIDDIKDLHQQVDQELSIHSEKLWDAPLQQIAENFKI